MIPVLIGQIGAGKTAVGQRLAALTGRRLVSVDALRAQLQDTSTAGLVGALTAEGKDGAILETTGAAAAFETLLAALEAEGEAPFVILLDCPIEVAMERVRRRQPWTPPVGGGSWAPHLRWTATRLRLVPADLTLPVDRLEPDAAATRILEALRQAAATVVAPAVGNFSYSQLAAYEVCPLAYRFKYVERQPERLETEAMFLGKRLHEALALLYRPGRAEAVDEAAVQGFLAARIAETVPDGALAEQRQRLVAQAADRLHRHYVGAFAADALRTEAVEHPFRWGLSPGLAYSGIIDRIAFTPSGICRVIDYKSSARSTTSRPRIPDLLQIAAYGAGAMLAYGLDTVIACRHALPTGEQDEIVLRLDDMARIGHALRRWIVRCLSDASLAAKPGRHCRSCTFNPICPAPAVPADPNALVVVSR